MRLFSVALCALFLFGCASVTQPIENNLIAELRDKEGILAEPPSLLILDKEIHQNHSAFKRCEPIKVRLAYRAGLEITQGNSRYVDMNSRRFENNSKLYLTSSLPGKNKTIKFKNGNRRTHDMLCEGRFWTGMSREELIFSIGRPEKINTSVYGSATHEQWVYQKLGGNQFEKNYFYFENGSLASWQY